MRARSRFEAELYVLSKEEGGRHKPFFSNYSPQFFIRTADVTGVTSAHLIATSGGSFLGSVCCSRSSIQSAGKCSGDLIRHKDMVYLLHAGVLKLPDDVKMAMPGDNVRVTVELKEPLALCKGLRFALREGGRTVGAGLVSEVLD